MKMVCLVLSLILLGGGIRAQEWEIEYLPELPGSTYSSAYGANDRGQIVGYCRTGSRDIPVLWDKGEVYPLPIPEGYQEGMARAINNSGLIAGYVYYEVPGPFDKSGVCVWNTQCQLIAAIEMIQYTRVLNLTDDGVVFGYTETSAQPRYRFYFTWTRREGVVKITDSVLDLSIYEIVRGSKMVGNSDYRAIVLEKSPGSDNRGLEHSPMEQESPGQADLAH